MNQETNFSIQAVIAAEVEKEREPRAITSWHCSGLGSCPTGRYLERLGLPPDEDFDARTLRVFSVGKMMEDWLVGKLQKAQISLQTQVRVEDKELGVSGYADAVVEQNGAKLVYEIKSKHSRAFWYMDKKKEGANLHHKMQLWFYLFNLNVPEGRLVYLSKDDLAILEYPVFLADEELRDSVLNEIALLNAAWTAKLPPLPSMDPKDWRSRYCRWHKQCVAQEKYYQSKN